VLTEYKRATNIGVGLGFVCLLAGRLMVAGAISGPPLIGWILFAAGLCVFLWGCGQYAKAKGHSPLWGALGLLYIIGLIALFFFPDRHKLARRMPGDA
jgi:hypothetical protein